jgi:hypothetical protein
MQMLLTFASVRIMDAVDPKLEEREGYFRWNF